MISSSIEPTASPFGLYTFCLRTRLARVRSGAVGAGAAVEAPAPDPVPVVVEVCASEIGAIKMVMAAARVRLCMMPSVLNSCGSRPGRLALPGFREARGRLVRRRPERADLGRQCPGNLAGLAFGDVPRQHLKDGLHRVLDIYRPNVRKLVSHSGEEFLLVPLPGRLHLRLPLVVVNAPNQQRQLGAEMRRFFERKAITQRPQCRPEGMPSKLAVRADCGHNLIEPDVRGL